MIADANYKFSKAWTGNFGMYYSTNADKFTGVTGSTWNNDTGSYVGTTAYVGGYPFQVYTFGAKGKLSDDFGLTAQYFWNGAQMPGTMNLPDNKNGWAAELAYKGADGMKVGSWGLSVNYRDIKPFTADVAWVSGIFGNSSYGYQQIAYGVKGFGVTADYTISKNAILSFTYESLSTNNTYSSTLNNGTSLNSARYLPYYYMQMNVKF